MTDLTKEDQARKEAGDKYFKSDSRESWDLAIAGNDWNAGWQAACAYKDKRIAELEAEIELLRGLLTEALPFVNADLPWSLSKAERMTKALSEGGGDE